MIYIKSDDEELCREMLGSFKDRELLSIGGNQYVLCDITRNSTPFDQYSVEAKGERVIMSPWTGQGLPPVGTVCEYSLGTSGQWFKCEVRYIAVVDEDYEPYCVIWCPHISRDQVVYFDGVEFRKIRTPEQIAAEERDAAIKHACEAAGCSVGSNYGLIIEKVIDAGYRKP